MQSTFDIIPMVRKYSAIPLERLQIISNTVDLHLERVRRGVLFVFAAWSGQAVLALQRLTRLLGSRDFELLDLIVIDIECMTAQEMTQIFGRTLHGDGETFWIREGKLVASLEVYKSEIELMILAYTKRLLDEKPAAAQ
jgi:hypothetical protein